jgi:hypothetical protein
MKSFAAAAALVALVPSVMGLTVNSPSNVVECEPFQFTWSGGTPPYFLSLIPATDQNPIKQFPQQTGTSFTWLVDLQANTNFNAALKDSTGTQVFSGQATIIAGSSTSCLNTAINDNGSGSVAATSGGSSSAAANATTTHSGSGSTTASSTSSTSSKTNAATAGSSASTFGIASLFGLVGAILF